MMTNQINSYKALLERVMLDENFKSCFIADPKAILIEAGAKIPDSLKIEVHEDRPNLLNFVLQKKEQLEKVNLEGEHPIISQVLKRALADDTFKARLLQNPKAAIKEATGEDLPETLTICIHEDTPNVKHLVIPVNPNNQELSDTELEMVAGGILGLPSIPGFPQIKRPPIITGFIAFPKL